MSDSIFIVLAEGFEEIEAIAPIDVLRRAGLEVTVIGLSSRVVTGAHGISIQTDVVWEEVAASTPHVLVFPGGLPGASNLGKHIGLKEMAIRVAAAENGILAAICASPAFTLASWGLLSGRTATCFPGCETQFLNDVTYKNESVIVDGRIITARGPGSALDFSITLVAQLLDKTKAEKIQSQMQIIR
ncbi:MAG: DJ-1 family glyoxalase III [Thermoguttaceae bacterium]